MAHFRLHSLHLGCGESLSSYLEIPAQPPRGKRAADKSAARASGKSSGRGTPRGAGKKR